jgi:competence protein ComQ
MRCNTRYRNCAIVFRGVIQLTANHSTLIKKSIYQIVNEQIDQNELKELILQFVDFQSEKGFPFGELLILHYRMFNGVETEEIYAVAAAVEILILSFDILDDFEDDDCIDKPWLTDPKLALNATTALQFVSLRVIQNSSLKNKDKCFSLIMEYALKSIHGQHKDLLNICKTESDYIEMSLEKSGSLVALVCVVGAVLAADDDSVMIETYAKNIGLIGQINNDLEDIKIWNQKNDLLNKKYSLPIIYLMNCQDENAQWIRNFYQNKVSKEEIIMNQELIHNIFFKTGAIAYTEVIKKIYQNKVLAQIKGLNIDQCYIDQLLKYIN